MNDIRLSDLYIRKKTLSNFINTCITAHNKLRLQFKNDLEIISNEEDSRPHIMYLKTLSNQSLKALKEFSEHQQYMITNYRRLNVTKLGHLKQQIDTNNPRLLLERFQLWNSLPISWRKVISKSQRFTTYIIDEWDEELKFINIGLNKWVDTNNIQSRDIYERLMEAKVVKTSNNLLNTKHETNLTTDDESPFVRCFKMTKNIKIRNVQYKILHNIYPTMKILHKWNIKPSPNCTNCNREEDLVHAIWTCPIAVESIDNIKRLYNEVNRENQIDLNKEDIIYGIKNKDALNTIITLIKQRLILQRENKQIISRDEIMEIIKREIRIESYIAKKSNRMPTLLKKWKDVIKILG